MLSRHLNTFAYDGYGLAQELVTMKSGELTTLPSDVPCSRLVSTAASP